jgi:hypothetical protein
LNVRHRIAFTVLLAFASPAFSGAALAQSAIAAAVAKPVSSAGHCDRICESADHPYRIFVDELPALRALRPECVPMLRSKYIDTGKVRFVFREFPLDIKAAAASILARCIGNGDSEKYLSAVETCIKLQDRLMAQTKDTLIYVGKQHGMSEQDVETCEKDQRTFDKLTADQQYAVRGVEGHLDADLLSQRHAAAGLDAVRGAGRADQAVAQKVAAAGIAVAPCRRAPPRR